MNKVACLLFSSMALVVGCGSSGGDSSDPFGPAPDFGSVQAHFDHPDGTLSSGNAGALFDKTSQPTDGLYGPGSSSSGGTTTKSIRILGGSSAFAGCTPFVSGQRSGSCQCPDGGSIAWDVSGNNAGGTMRFRADACRANDVSIDGTEYLRVAGQKNPDGSYASSMLLVAHLTVAKAAEVHTIDLEEQFSEGKLEMSVKVDDGWVVLSFTTSPDGKSGSFTVRDRNGTHTCVVDNGKGTCTDERGETVAFGG